MKYNKLVRDRIPEIIAEDGREPATRILDEDEYIAELERKLREECEEVIAAGDGDTAEHRLEELGDVLEVMLALAEIDHFNLDDIVFAAEQKRQERGGFDKRIYLVED